MFTLTPKQKNVQHKRAWGTPRICATWCPGMQGACCRQQTGLCRQQNSRTAFSTKTRNTRVFVPNSHPPGNVITSYCGGILKP